MSGRDLAPAVAVTGLGAVSAAGIGVSANWQTVRNGEPTAATDVELAGLPVDFDCRAGDFDAATLLGKRTAWRYDRYTQLALVAAREAVADAGFADGDWDPPRVGVVLGSALGGTGTTERVSRTLFEQGPRAVSPMMIPMAAVNMVAGYLAMDLTAHGPNFVTATACASGTTAIGTARMLLASGACDIVVTGGAESSLSPAVVTAFARMGALSERTACPAAASRPFDAGRDGFVIAEGAGIMVLERAEYARARGARVHSWLTGYGASADAHHATAPDPEGAGADRAIRAALADAGLTAADVDHINAHGTSTPLNDLTESRVLHRIFGDAVSVTSTKGVTGHALGAAGALEAIYTVLALRDQVAVPTANLDSLDPEIRIDVVQKTERPQQLQAAVSESFGFGGQNAVLVFQTEPSTS